MNLEYKVRKLYMLLYFNQAQALSKKFKVCEFHHYRRQNNIKADALARLVASMDLAANDKIDLQVVQRRLFPPLNTHEVVVKCFQIVGSRISTYESSFKDWINAFIDYILYSIFPEDPKERAIIQR